LLKKYGQVGQNSASFLSEESSQLFKVVFFYFSEIEAFGRKNIVSSIRNQK
jgi:hypothetical protein